ncbi:MAG: acyl-CoA dehydrogenase [Actinomycetia bacterium]|nr:acyl-CoA dehydrogenase [Actinomycetes bacterium]MCP4224989.1 acyl-CoA dehydrogenase [Actinomycetes bacterium]MCP5030245.1 acyl-CoA dehydrogenase [Actinomycetes bacterium]
MDFDLPDDDDQRRLDIRAWLRANPNPTGRQLAGAGYVVPHWPAPWGLEADGIHQLIIAQELEAAGVTLPSNPIGIGWAAPTILMAGTPEQQQRYLPPILSGDEIWCQLFSEPDAGSDLANLATRAVLDGDEYVINGSKIWSSGAHHSKMGILIARTDTEVTKHKGISYFLLPIDSPGITMTPIIDMAHAYSFNQVFFDDVRLPVANRLGEEGDGWRLARATLANERVSLSSGGLLWGGGPSAEDLVDLMGGTEAANDPLLRQQLIDGYLNGEVLGHLQNRALSSRLNGETPGPEASVLKIKADHHGQDVMRCIPSLMGAEGMLASAGPDGPVPETRSIPSTDVDLPVGPGSPFPNADAVWYYGFLFSSALTIGGGTFAIQRNVVGEHVLGLPREPDPHRGMTWAESRTR